MNKLELKEFRKNIGLERQDFADKLGISIHTLDSWESGKRNIPKTKIRLIKAVFDRYNVPENNSKDDLDIPFFEFEGKKIHPNVVIDFIVKHEKVLHEKIPYFRYWQNDKLRGAIERIQEEELKKENEAKNIN